MSESCIRAFAEVIDETTDYGAMALVMQQACIDQGVPPEAFGMIDVHETKTSIPVGAGSKAARSAEFEAGATLYQEMDDTGRQNFNKDRAIHGFGVQNAKRYLNFEDQPREIQDVRNALFENNDLMPSPITSSRPVVRGNCSCAAPYRSGMSATAPGIRPR